MSYNFRDLQKEVSLQSIDSALKWIGTNESLWYWAVYFCSIDCDKTAGSSPHERFCYDHRCHRKLAGKRMLLHKHLLVPF